jgi:hypothetical protein
MWDVSVVVYDVSRTLQLLSELLVFRHIRDSVCHYKLQKHSTTKQGIHSSRTMVTTMTTTMPTTTMTQAETTATRTLQQLEQGHNHDDEEEEGPHCLVCYEDTLEYKTLLPCNHNNMCPLCTLRLRQLHNNKKCPICQQENQQFIFDESATQQHETFAAYPISDSDWMDRNDFISIESLGAFCRVEYYHRGVVQPFEQQAAVNISTKPIPRTDTRDTDSATSRQELYTTSERCLAICLLVSVVSVTVLLLLVRQENDEQGCKFVPADYFNRTNSTSTSGDGDVFDGPDDNGGD